MTVKSEKDLMALMKIGRIVGLTIRAMQEALHSGMTTAELDSVGGAFLEQHGARSAPILTYRYPGVTCISVDDEAAHGIPGKRVIREGDLVKIDVSAELEGYFADAAVTVALPPVDARKEKLVECARTALAEAINAARAGQPFNAIGEAAERTVRGCGFHIIRELPGHGVGRGLHEPPTVPTFFVPRATKPIPEGLVFTIEPHVAAGRGQIYTDRDGWTLKTQDRSLVAAFEHTVVITQDRPILVTAV